MSFLSHMSSNTSAFSSSRCSKRVNNLSKKMVLQHWPVPSTCVFTTWPCPSLWTHTSYMTISCTTLLCSLLQLQFTWPWASHSPTMWTSSHLVKMIVWSLLKLFKTSHKSFKAWSAQIFHNLRKLVSQWEGRIWKWSQKICAGERIKLLSAKQMRRIICNNLNQTNIELN